jgi:hypothetical protein
MEKKTTSIAIVLTLAFGIILASSTSSIGPTIVVFAQKNQTKAPSPSSSSNSNQTTVTPAGKQATKIINQTTIPANQTSTTIEKTAKPVEKTPLSVNQTKNLSSSSSTQAKLPPVSNKTEVTPAGKATTTVINQTSTPVNVSTTTTGNATKQPASPPSAANQTTTAAKQQQQPANQTENNTGNPLAKIPIIGKIFGGK